MTIEETAGFFAAKIPKTWFTAPVRLDVDDDEIVCIGTLPPGRAPREFREATRAERMAIAAEAEAKFRRKVSWGVEHDGDTTLFTTLTIPAMTRLRLPERRVLDTLVEAGIARSRSEALAWCVRLVGRHEADWLGDLRDALVGVERIRAEGPTLL
jgi:hypothetical protein